MLKLACAMTALLLVASPAIAQTPADPPAKEDAKKSDANRIVCQREDSIGSRLSGKKVCLTVKEWKERAQASREETERVQQGTFLARQ